MRGVEASGRLEIESRVGELTMTSNPVTLKPPPYPTLQLLQHSIPTSNLQNLQLLPLLKMSRPDITLYTAQTPNGIKISMALEELEYAICPNVWPATNSSIDFPTRSRRSTFLKTPKRSRKCLRSRRVKANINNCLAGS